MSEEPKLKANSSVGHQLKSRRQALRLSLAQVELETKIRGKFLKALESGDYSSLPNDVYSRGFVSHYASHLGLDGAEIATKYLRERGGIVSSATKQPQLDCPKKLVFTGPLIASATIIVLVGAFVSYLLVQLSALAAAPQLIITSPTIDTSITGGVIDLSGRTTPGSDISINDSAVLTDTNGGFSEKVSLQEGVNVIRVAAKSKLGKSTTLTRNVLAHLPKVDSGSVVVPGATFDGIAIAIKVKSTTSMVVTVDGSERFRGIIVSGKTQLFTGTKDISITTGNAGATGLILTNSTVANKKIDSLGGEGEIRRNQVFAKETVFQ